MTWSMIREDCNFLSSLWPATNAVKLFEACFLVIISYGGYIYLERKLKWPDILDIDKS
jgi:hypothetical protein